MNVQLIDKREIIFESSVELLQDHGFHGTPMSQIAKKANVSVGTIYHYFDSKETLIMELYGYCKCRLMRYLFEGLATNTENYETHFRITWKRFVQFYLDHPHYFRFMNQFYSSPFYEMEYVKREKTKKTWAISIQQFLEFGVEKKTLINTSTEILWSAYIGVAVSFLKSIHFGKMEMTDKNMEEMVDIVWKSIKAA
ncbi:TetR/AcrR family transcriptional regulator [Sphingobacterium corticis]|uniref:TetR/AcrR family transcriptional regulator n=1 Tax=Sphingobacterium corticis TaxID=1812823 RepID=A0ABW5NEM9_9SPHI